MKVKTWHKWALAFLILLTVFRLTLPFTVKAYVNKVLNDIPGYQGSVDKIGISLLRGAYEIYELKLALIEEDESIPFLTIGHADLSIEWKALLKGSIVSEIIMDSTEFSFFIKQDTLAGDHENTDWTQPIRNLVPFSINQLTVHNSKIALYSFTTEPDIDLYLYGVELTMTNLTNAEDLSNPLPSDVNFTARSIGNGNLSIAGGLNAIKEIPDFDIEIKFEDVDLPALNDFTLAYGGFDFEAGKFELFGEIAVADGQLVGYIKPFLNDAKVINKKKEKGEFWKTIWEGIVGFTKEVFENQKKDELATRVPFSGDLTQVDAKILPTIINIIRNAFIQSLPKKIDQVIDFDDAKKE